MATERTDEELAEDEIARSEIQLVLDEATAAVVSWQLAERLDEPAQVCERWIDAIYDTIRDGLDPEQRVSAIAMLLDKGSKGRAAAMLRELNHAG